MSEISAYRQRTRAVRSAARERLRELREERLARRGDALRPAGPASGASDSPTEIAVSRAASMVAAGGDVAGAEAECEEGLDHEPVSDPFSGAASEPEEPAIARSGEIGLQPSAPESVKTSGPHADAERACDTDGSDVPDACLSQDAVDVGEASSSLAGHPAHQAPRESDLTLLPGAGDGLVWMLGQCGIYSLAELGRADADELTERMGLAGQMLDLHAWIAFARAATEEGSRPDETSRP